MMNDLGMTPASPWFDATCRDCGRTRSCTYVRRYDAATDAQIVRLSLPCKLRHDERRPAPGADGGKEGERG